MNVLVALFGLLVFPLVAVVSYLVDRNRELKTELEKLTVAYEELSARQDDQPAEADG